MNPSKHAVLAASVFVFSALLCCSPSATDAPPAMGMDGGTAGGDAVGIKSAPGTCAYPQPNVPAAPTAVLAN